MPLSLRGGQQQETTMPAVDEVENENRNSIDGGGSSGEGRGSRRSSEQPHPYRYYYNTALHSRTMPTPAEEKRFRICVTLITTWLFMIVSALFLACYVYLLEWSPETADPIHVFSLEIAVNLLYVMFVIDILAGIAVIVSQMEYVGSFSYRIFWPAVGCLCLNQLHATFIWLWVWTGEFPRTCARNTFYFGRQCANLLIIIKMANDNPDGSLSLSDCKCDYGQCLPECKGLRTIQDYFWGTYCLYILRFVCLIIFIPVLRSAVCQCKWCCCTQPLMEVRTARISQSPVPMVCYPDENGNNLCNCNGHTGQSLPNNGFCYINGMDGQTQCISVDNREVCTHCHRHYHHQSVPKTRTVLASTQTENVKKDVPIHKVSHGTGESHYVFDKRNNRLK